MIDRDSYLWAVARYIERNPVRVGVVEKADDYHWSSAKAHVSGAEDPLLSSSDWIADEERDAYARFLLQADEEPEKIRKATASGRPIARKNSF